MIDSEKDIVDIFFRKLSLSSSESLDFSDDSAHLDFKGLKVIQTVDQCIEGVHFFKEDTPDTIANRSLKRMLSDIAASGAKPHSWLMSLSLPNTLTGSKLHKWLKDFSASAKKIVDYYNFPLIGGDLARNHGAIQLSITANATLKADEKSPIRSNVKAGDILLLAGGLGNSALYIEKKKNKKSFTISKDDFNHIESIYNNPKVFVDIGRQLAKIRAGAIDISDGLYLDACRLARASKVRIIIDFKRLPISDIMKAYLSQNPDDYAPLLGVGDDYSLLIATGNDNAKILLKNRDVLAIGRVEGIEETEGEKSHDSYVKIEGINNLNISGFLHF